MQASKEQLRKWMQERQKTPAPLPSQEEIRRQLGWPLLANNQGADRAR